jgi:hypothetical protein
MTHYKKGRPGEKGISGTDGVHYTNEEQVKKWAIGVITLLDPMLPSPDNG